MSERLEQKTSEEVTDTHEEAVTMETNNAESAETIVDNSSEPKEEKIAENKETNVVKKKTKKPLIIVISGAIVVALIVGIILLVVLNSKSAEAKRVDTLISSIGTVTLDSESKITEAEKEVEGLSIEDYKQLNNIEQLEKARKTYDNLVSKEKADKIIALINEIGNVTIDSENKSNAARSAFDAARNSVQELVTNKDKLVEAEDIFYGLKAEKVIALINSIGSVNKNSENRIKEADTAYKGLPTEAKNKVTNYSALTTAKSELSSIKKQAVKQRMDDALGKLNKTVDDVKGLIFYESPSKPQYADTRSFVLPYIGMRNENDAWLCLNADYTGDNWVFYDSLYINADGQRFNKTCSRSDINRDNKNGIVWEWYNAGISESDIEWLKAVANSNNATIRFSGKYNYDLKVSDSDKQAIKQVLEAYEAITDYALFDIYDIISD